VTNSRMGRRAQIGPSVGFVSHREHLKGVCATASAQCDSAYGVR
jgi:hypothetical protein